MTWYRRTAAKGTGDDPPLLLGLHHLRDRVGGKALGKQTARSPRSPSVAFGQRLGTLPLRCERGHGGVGVIVFDALPLEVDSDRSVTAPTVRKRLGTKHREPFVVDRSEERRVGKECRL